MKTLKFIAPAIGIVITTTALATPKLVCTNGKAFVQTISFDTGCVHPPVPYYEKLYLDSKGIDGGTIEISIGHTFPTKDPNCENPRGIPYYHYLPLPVESGAWEIILEEHILGEVSFPSFLSCVVKG